jgi:anti-sigma B factor antagonist
MNTSQFVKENITVFNISGRFVMANSNQVKKEIDEAVLQGVNQLIIDLSEVDFIDSSALGVLIIILKKMQEHSRSLCLVTNAKVQSVIELTRLHTLFTIAPTLDQAIATLQK